jgi:hypothetical protein
MFRRQLLCDHGPLGGDRDVRGGTIRGNIGFDLHELQRGYISKLDRASFVQRVPFRPGTDVKKLQGSLKLSKLRYSWVLHYLILLYFFFKCCLLNSQRTNGGFRYSRALAVPSTCQYRSTTGASSCAACPSGCYCPAAGLSAYSTCALGTYSAASASSCTSCSAGTYADSTAAAACTSCPAGQYQGLWWRPR